MGATEYSSPWTFDPSDVGHGSQHQEAWVDGARTGMLSVSTRRTLDRHIERALRERLGSSASLRQVVRIAVLEIAAAGGTPAEIRELLTRAVLDHPERITWDQVSILTGLQISDVLTQQVLAWVAPPPAGGERHSRSATYARNPFRGT